METFESAKGPKSGVQEIFSLQRRTCLVTGAGGYLGSSMALAIASAGGFVYLAGRDIDKLDSVKTKIKKNGGCSRSLSLDLTDRESIQKCVKTIREEHGSLDILINNAYAGTTGPFHKIVSDDFLNAYQVGMCGVVNLIDEALPLLKKCATKDRMSSIINIASMYGVVSPVPKIYGNSGHDNPPSYGAMKAALIHYTKYAAANLARENIRVNAISPGAFPRPSVEISMPDLWSKLNSMQPLERIGRPEELQGAVLFLASNASSYVTGHNLVVDGGWTIW